MSPEESAFLAAIIADPDNDLPRLVFADWLEEHGRTERAEFIRLQCERARIQQFWDDAEQLGKIKQREQALWTAHRQAWRVGLPKALHNDPFRRGFVYPWRVYGGEKFLGLKPDALDAAPRWAGTVEKFVRLFDRVFASKLLLRFDELTISMGRQQIPFAQLAGNDLLRSVSDLRLNHDTNVDGWDDPDGIAAFFGGPATASVTRLDCYARLGEESFAALAASPVARKLTHLRLAGWRFGAGGVPFPAAQFPQLRSLRLGVAGVSVFRYVLDTPGLQLRELEFHGLNDEQMTELAAWPGLAQVRSLDLSQTYSRSREGFLALVRSPHAGGLCHLKVDAYSFRDFPDGKAELEARFGAALEYYEFRRGARRS